MSTVAKLTREDIKALVIVIANGTGNTKQATTTLVEAGLLSAKGELMYGACEAGSDADYVCDLFDQANTTGLE